MPDKIDPVICTLQVRGPRLAVNMFRTQTRRRLHSGGFCSWLQPIPEKVEDQDAWCQDNWGTPWGAFNIENMRIKYEGDDALLTMDFVCKNTPPTASLYFISKYLTNVEFRLDFRNVILHLGAAYKIYNGMLAAVATA